MKRYFFTLFGWAIALTSFSQDIKSIPIQANDLIYVPGEDRIYATTSSGQENGNSLCRIDPYFGTVEATFFIGSEPGKLALSDDGAFLYIGLRGAPEVVRFDMASHTAGQRFGLGTDPFLGAYYVEDMIVLPAAPHSVVIARRNECCSPMHEGVAIYDDGIQRTAATQDHTGSNSLAFGASNGKLYGYNNESTEFGFRELAISPDGLTERAVFQGVISGFGARIESQGQYIYSSNGEVADISATAPTKAGQFFSPYFTVAVEPAPDSNVVYFIAHDFSGGVFLETYDKTTYNNLSRLHIQEVDATFLPPLPLISWGTSGKLAFVTPEEVVIIRNCRPLFTEPLVLEAATTGGCWGESITLTAPGDYDSYYWADGSRTQSISVESPGEYYVSVPDSLGCLSPASNTVAINFDNPPYAPYVDAAPDVTICQGEVLSLSAIGFTYSPTYVWSTGATTSSIDVSVSGTYSVTEISPNGCPGEPSGPIVVTVLDEPAPEQPAILIDGEATFCVGNSTFLSAPAGFSAYLWSNGATTREIEVFNSGSYTVQVENSAGCRSMPSEAVEITAQFTPGQPFIEASGNVLASPYPIGNQWFFNGVAIDGANGQFLMVTEAGFYSLQVTIQGCASPLSAPFNYLMTDTQNPALAGGIRAYPNPAGSLLWLEGTGGVPGPAHIQVFSANGQLVLQASARPSSERQELSVGGLSPGLYVLRVTGSDGQVFSSSRFVKL